MNEILLMTHVLLSVLCLLATVWLFVDTLDANAARIRHFSRAIAVSNRFSQSRHRVQHRHGD